MARFSFFCSLLLFAAVQSHMLVAESTHSDAKMRPSSSKASNIARCAERELANQSKDGALRAITLLQELSSSSGFSHLQVDERIHIYRLLAKAYSYADKLEMQQALLTKLLKDKAFKPYWISLKASLGDCYLAQENLILASKITKEMLRTPKRRLSSEDAASVARLIANIERHITLRLKTAERLYSQNEYQKASGIYQYLYNAALAHAFAQTYSKLSFKCFLDSLSIRLANCYFQQQNYQATLMVFASHDPQNTSSYALQAMAEKNRGDFAKALQHLEKIDAPNQNLLYEACLCAYKAKNPEKAAALSELFLQKHPKSPLYAEILFEKAILAWQQDDHENAFYAFSQLKASYPDFSRLDAALFFMASMLKNTDPEARALYHEVVRRFPQSNYAPESYYRMYPEEMYLSCDIQAMGHLKKMPKAYAKSPFGVLALLCVARFEQEECPKNSVSASQVKTLTEIVAVRQEAIEQGKMLMNDMPQKMRAIFWPHLMDAEYEQAQCYFTLGNFDNVRAACETLKNTINQLAEETKPHLLWHKAAFLQSRTLLLQGKEAQAREELTNLIEYSAATGFEKSEPLALALIELADMKARDNDYDIAFLMLNKALTLQTTSTNDELLLEILIAKSQLHRKTGELDKAMILLSSVINDESASSLRIQAMFLRAEIYELKGRRDLAFRQLQTTAKKGGEWGLRAAKKLEEKYGYE